MCSKSPLGTRRYQLGSRETSLENLKMGLFHNHVVLTSSHLRPTLLLSVLMKIRMAPLPYTINPLKGELKNNQSAHLRTQARDKERRGGWTAIL